MPKIKTHKATAKRFKKRNSGSIKRGKAYATHLLRPFTKRKETCVKNGSEKPGYGQRDACFKPEVGLRTKLPSKYCNGD